jgi:RNase P/RNase MRP subunit p30
MIGYIEPLVNMESIDHLTNYDSIAEKLGIAGFVIQNKKYKDLNGLQTKVHHFSRSSLTLESVNQVRKTLPKVRKSYDIVSIHTNNSKIAQWVAKDNRVDILAIPYKHQKKIIIPTLANVAAQNRTFFEIDLSPLLYTNYKLSVFPAHLPYRLKIIPLCGHEKRTVKKQLKKK